MQQCQGRAGSRKNCEKNPANCAAAVVSRARRRFSMGVWTCSLRGTQRQSHTYTETRTQVAFITASAIVRVRVAKIFWAMAQLAHASLSVQCKRAQHSLESGLFSQPLSCQDSKVHFLRGSATEQVLLAHNALNC